MSGSELEACLETRVRDLERRLARGRATAIGAVVLVVAACAAAAARSDVEEVRARRFVVVDEQGEVRATFSSDAGSFDAALTMQARGGGSHALFAVSSKDEGADTSTAAGAVLSMSCTGSDDALGSVFNCFVVAKGTQLDLHADDSAVGLSAEPGKGRIEIARHDDDEEENDRLHPKIEIAASRTDATLTVTGPDGATRAKLP